MELLRMCLLPANLGATLFLAMIVLYWLMVILGALDLDFLDFDIDADADADLDMDADIADVPAGLLDGVLAFFYLGKIPVMILLSVAALCIWVISIIANSYLNPSGSFLLGLPVSAATLAVSPFVCKVICMPLAKFFAVAKTDYNAPPPVIGQTCTVTTTQVSAKMGQAEIATSGAPILLNVITDGNHVCKKGDAAVVVRKDEKKGVHIIAPINLEDKKC